MDASEVVEPAPVVSRYAPSTIGGVFYIGILAAALVGLLVASLADWRTGIRILASVLAAAALLRLVLPEKDAGMLAVRHRFLDVGVLVLMGTVLFVLAATIPDQPAG